MYQSLVLALKLYIYGLKHAARIMVQNYFAKVQIVWTLTIEERVMQLSKKTS